ncbi:hypothetical protein B0H13DRAFT_1896336 [Mycena leptocephala]|nr:hypothetical protein B0H13DRAFT_1896336 [Mycena leptocephala]
MTTFPVASGTESPSVSVAASSPSNNSAALQLLSAAIVSLSQGGSPPGYAPAAPASAGSAPTPIPVAPAPAPMAAAVAPPGFRTRGPWTAGALYVVVPSGPLIAVAEAELSEGEGSPLWYCITKGCWVGVTLNNHMAVSAVQGVSSPAMKSYKTQSAALAAFNELLGYNMVTIVA